LELVICSGRAGLCSQLIVRRATGAGKYSL
jgi:hypothetical protein